MPTEHSIFLKHFKSVDPIILPWVKSTDYSFLNEPSEFDAFGYLCRAIVFQQLSGKAGATIFGRFQNLLNGDLTPENVLSVSHEDLRSVGLSNAKATYVND